MIKWCKYSKELGQKRDKEFLLSRKKYVGWKGESDKVGRFSFYQKIFILEEKNSAKQTRKIIFEITNFISKTKISSNKHLLYVFSSKTHMFFS